ncbi:MAG TPA: hypothetical protein VHA37_08110, partial [Candidatus Saccharimonadales bacterium]|nr:hypothetical protein [Candidatus Saccharimonadales bacterium]
MSFRLRLANESTPDLSPSIGEIRKNVFCRFEPGNRLKTKTRLSRRTREIHRTRAPNPRQRIRFIAPVQRAQIADSQPVCAYRSTSSQRIGAWGSPQNPGRPNRGPQRGSGLSRAAAPRSIPGACRSIPGVFVDNVLQR